jgi:hypothetical protein
MQQLLALKRVCQVAICVQAALDGRRRAEISKFDGEKTLVDMSEALVYSCLRKV